MRDAVTAVPISRPVVVGNSCVGTPIGAGGNLPTSVTCLFRTCQKNHCVPLSAVHTRHRYFAQLDEDKEVMVELAHDGTALTDGCHVYLQAATLYTTFSGERLIRVINLALPVTAKLANVFRYACIDTQLSWMHKKAAQQLQGGERTLAEVRKHMLEATVDVLYLYRKNCATGSSPGP